MNFGFLDALTVVGSLGVFLFGMKIMSEALQKVAGNKLRSILTAMTSNRFFGILTGVMITALIQSSSATTVMVVSFVNAGLLSLTQSFSVIMGANVGTTVTAWIISLFGFKVDISTLSVPLIAFSVPLIFSKNNSRRYWGELIMGFALLFLGIGFLKDSVPDVKSNPEILAFLAKYTNMGYASVFLFLLVGTILTIIVQSSSATMAITLIMCGQGWITFEIAAAMVLGENIGTTITANIAAWTANISAKRAAFSHFIFNIFGVSWILAVFYPFTNFVQYLVESFGSGEGAESAAFSLSLFHTLFNISNVFILVWFSNYIVKVVEKIIKKRKDSKKGQEEIFQLKYISTGLLSTSELSILQASKEIVLYSERTKRMFDQIREIYYETDETEFEKRFSRIEKYESISDRMEVEIANYLSLVSNGRLSTESKHQLQSKMRIVSEIESIADSCYNLARTIQRKKNKEVPFTKETNENIQKMFDLVDRAVDHMILILKSETLQISDINKSQNFENEINLLRNLLKQENIENINEGKYPYEISVIYMDMIVECEKMGDYIVNVVEAIVDSKLNKIIPKK